LAKAFIEKQSDWDVMLTNGQNSVIGEMVGDSLWAKKYFVDFLEYPDYVNNTKPELLTPENLKQWGGIAPGPFLEGQFYSLWVNQKVAEKIGIEVKQFDMTVDDFIGYLKAAYKYNQRNPNDYTAPIYESHTYKTVDIIGLMLYISCLDTPDDYLKAKVSAKRLKAWETTLKKIEEMSLYDPVFRDWDKVEWTATQNHLVDEKCLFYVNGSWMYNIWKEIDAEKVNNCAPLEFPKIKEHIMYPISYLVSWCVPKNAKNRDEAVKFLLEMNQPEVSESWTRHTKCPSGIKGNLSASSIGGDSFEEYLNYISKKYEKRNFNIYENPSWVLSSKFSKVDLQFYDVILGNKSVEEAMSQIKSKIGW